MNVKLLRKVQKHILEEPKRFAMSNYLVKKNEDETVFFTGIGRGNAKKVYNRNWPKCNTVACIAGWAVVLSGEDFTDYSFRWSSGAAELLDLTDEDSSRLFEPTEWPKEFQKGTSNDGRMATARIAARRIDRFIATKGAE